MKKWKIIFKVTLTVLMILLILGIYFIFYIKNNNYFFTYGKSKSLNEIIGLNEQDAVRCDSDIFKLKSNGKYKKAIVKDLGNTTRTTIYCYGRNDEMIAKIEVIGNRNLVRINNQLYKEE